MALDRTWYNTLVDDSGTGLDGSVWDKADVNSLMVAVDNEIARIDWADGASVTAVSRQTAIAPNLWGVLEFDTVVWQTSAGMYVPPQSYITVPRTGYYLVTGVVTFPQGDGIRGLQIFVGGAPPAGMAGQQVLQAATQLTYNVVTVSAVVKIDANQIVQIGAFQNTAAGIWSGGLNPQTANSLQVHRLK
jgi:hypothetical protein